MKSLLSHLERFFKSRGIVVSLLCFVASGAFYFLELDWERDSGQDASFHIASINGIKGSVKVKSAGSFVWRNLEDNALLFLNDTVMSGDNSFATIEIKSGGSFQVESNTFLVLDKRNSADLSLVKGSVIVRNRGEASAKRISRSDGSEMDVKDLAVKLIQPKSLSVFFAPPKTLRALKFSWSDLAGSKAHYTVQVSDSQNFDSTVLMQFKGSAQGAYLEAKIPKGIYFWRVVNALGLAVSETSQFSIIEAKGLTPLEPADKTLSWNDSVNFSWMNPADSALSSDQVQNVIEISRDGAFKNILHTKNIQGSQSSVKFTGISEGNYFWRIKSILDSVQVYGDVLSFELERARFLSIETLLPAREALIRKAGLITFTWKSNAKEAVFDLEIQNLDTKEKNQIKTQGTSYVLSNLKAGNYQWRLSAKAGSFKHTTAWKSFSVLEESGIALTYPKGGQSIKDAEAENGFNFQWSSSNPEALYRVELASDRNFSNILSSKEVKGKKVSSAEVIVNAFDFYYFWRLVSLSKNSKPVSISGVEEFSYSNTALAQAPELRSPPEGATVSLTADQRNVQFVWTQARGASSYELSIYTSLEGTKLGDAPIIRTATTKTSHSLNSLPEGRYQWTVKSIDARGKVGVASSFRDLKISYGALLRAPASRSEQVQ